MISLKTRIFVPPPSPFAEAPRTCACRAEIVKRGGNFADYFPICSTMLVLKDTARLSHRLGGIDVDRRARTYFDVDDADRAGLHHMPGADIALEPRHLGEQRPWQDHRIAAFPVMRGANNLLSAGGDEARNQPVKIARLMSGMSPSTIRAPAAFCGSLAMPAFSELARPLAKSGLSCHPHIQPRERLTNALSLIPGDDRCGFRLAGKHSLGHAPHQRLAIEAGKQLVGSAHARRAACRQKHRMDRQTIRPPCLSRLRSAGNLHQQAAYPHAGDVAAGHVKAGQQPVEHPIEAVLLWAAGAARSADDILPANLAKHHEVTGIDRHTGPHHFAARRRIADGMTSSKSQSAEAPKTIAMSFSARTPMIARATSPVSCAVRHSSVTTLPDRSSRASVTREVLAITLSFSPGSMVWIRPTRCAANG